MTFRLAAPAAGALAALALSLAPAALAQTPPSAFGGPFFGPQPLGDPTSIGSNFVDAVAWARTSIDIAQYEITSQDGVDALIQAAGNGVAVRVVTDSSYTAGAPYVSQLAGTTGIRVSQRAGNTYTGIMHDKYMILDGMAVWTGSANLTTGSSSNNVENTLMILSSDLAADYESDFNQMFAGKFGLTKTTATPRPTVSVPDGMGGQTRIDAFFSGEDAAAEFQALAALVASAQASVQFFAYEFKESNVSQPLVDALAQAAQSGIYVQGLFDQSTSVQQGMNSQTAGDLAAAGASTILWNPQYGFTHSKVFVIDGTTVELGSFNYTQQASGQSSTDSNDENFLIVHNNAAIAGAYQADFASEWAQAGGQPLPSTGPAPSPSPSPTPSPSPSPSPSPTPSPSPSPSGGGSTSSPSSGASGSSSGGGGGGCALASRGAAPSAAAPWAALLAGLALARARRARRAA
jgi:phosphatidylserine/phosphatidylglycerophosphate/cardiolipin synthase-like enzyme